MNRSDFSIVIANDTEREYVFAEICYKDEQWAEISIETDRPLLTLFPQNNQKFWEFPLDEAMNALEMAKKKLLG